MRLLFDINHPAHVHFFRVPIAELKSRGHEILVTSRTKDCALPLLDELELPHRVLSEIGKSGSFGLLKELVNRDLALRRVAQEFKPDKMVSIGGTFIAHVGKMTGIPSIIFYDTENAKLQNLITYPLCSHLFVPCAYQAWLPKKHTRYPGYHELSYLHPNQFSPNRQHALDNGLSADRPTYFIRLVSWQANHDIGETGWNNELLSRVIEQLSVHGKVLISSECPLPERFQDATYRGKVSAIHHVMAFCSGYIGESATMASECAVLGVPAVYAAQTGRGYTDEQEKRYGLVKNIFKLDADSIETGLDWLLNTDQRTWKIAQQRLLEETIDVAAFVADAIESYPAIPPLPSCTPTPAGGER